MNVNLDGVSEEQIESIMVYAVKCFGGAMKGKTIKFNHDGSVSVYEIGETVSKTHKSVLAYVDFVSSQEEAADETTVKH